MDHQFVQSIKADRNEKEKARTKQGSSRAIALHDAQEGMKESQRRPKETHIFHLINLSSSAFSIHPPAPPSLLFRRPSSTLTKLSYRQASSSSAWPSFLASLILPS